MSTSPAADRRSSAVAAGDDKPPIVKVVFASLIGTAVEWYDFFLYGSAAALVFGALFFSQLEGIGYQLASILAGAIAPIVAISLLGDVDAPNTTAVALHVTVTSVLTIVAVLLVKETRNTSLRHDRVVEGAHD